MNRLMSSVVSRLHRHGWRWAAASALVSGGAAIAWAAADASIETVPYTNRTHLIVGSTEEERLIGDFMYRHHLQAYGGFSGMLGPRHPDSVRAFVITHDLTHAVRHLKTLTHRGTTTRLDGLEWHTLVVRREGVRAHHTPDGKIFLYAGCFRHLKTDDEIASLIAHEIAHVVARHGMERLQYWWLPSRLRRRLMHKQELEADRIGMLLLAAAGYDPRAAPKFFATVNDIQGHPEEASHTHPSAETRFWLLSRGDIMEEALQLYREAKAVKSLCLTLRVLRRTLRSSDSMTEFCQLLTR